MEEEIKVSISCITYNHESYIAQSLEGFLMQKCDFAFEVLIHDDASTDNTAKIIREYAAKYPEIIKPIFQKENQFSKGIRGITATFNLPRAKGKYIALCEGDDYWTDPLKLQKQVDFLEKNEEYGMVCTKYKTLTEDVLESADFLPRDEIEITTERLLQSNPVGTLTVLFDKDLFFKFAKNINFKMDLDIWLHLSTAEKKIKYLPIETAVYRVLQNSASGRSSFKKQAFFAKNVSAVREPFFKLSNLSAEQIDKILLKDFVLITNILIKGKHHRIWGQEWFRYLMGNKIRINVIPIFLKQLYRLLKD